MPLWHYYLRNDPPSDWLPVQAVNVPILSDARHITVYAQDRVHDDNLDYETDVGLQGDLVFDIDRPSISDGIKQVHKLLFALQSLELELAYIQFWASGGKGFHVIVPQRTFGDTKPTKKLNLLHKFMAVSIATTWQVEGVDFGMFAKRHTLRVEGKRREDGRYKVPLSLEEIRSLTPERYYEITSAPRKLPTTALIPQAYVAPGLLKLWEAAKKHVEEDSKRAKKHRSVESLPEGVPKCVEMIANGEGIKPGATFHDLTLNLAGFLLNANIPDTEHERIINSACANNPSQTYSTPTARRVHIQEALTYGKSKFSCGANLATLTANPCSGCPIAAAAAEELQRKTAIEERVDGLWMGEKQLTNFTMRVVSEVLSERAGVEGAEYTEAVVFPTDGGDKFEMFLPSTAWQTIRGFKESLAPYHHRLAILASSDAEIVRIKLYLNGLREDRSDDTVECEKVGMQHGPEGMTYVEPGWALSPMGSNTWLYTGRAVSFLTSLRDWDGIGGVDDPIHKYVRILLKSNRPHVVGQMLGWNAAVWLKEHLVQEGIRSFPLLHPYGLPGSGKTATASLYAALSGADYLHEAPMTGEVATKQPVRDRASLTASHVFVLDEVNPTKMDIRHFATLVAILKGCYERQGAHVGLPTAGKRLTRRSEELALIAPVCFCATEQNYDPQIVQRCIVVPIARGDHEVNGYRQAFQQVEREAGYAALWNYAKTLARVAVNTTTENAIKLFDEQDSLVPAEYQDRARKNLKIVLMGLDFFCLAPGVPGDIIDEVKALKEEVVRWWADERSQVIAYDHNILQADVVLKDFVQMAAIRGASYSIGRDTHYKVSGANLYLNVNYSWPLYLIYVRALGRQPEFMRETQYWAALSQAPYYLGRGPVPGLHAQDWACLSMEGMMKQKIDLQGFMP